MLVILLTQLLNHLLVLVQLLQVLNSFAVNLDGLGLLAVLHITQHAHLHAWAGNVWQLNTAAEALVLLGIVVLQTNLQFDGLAELALLCLRPLNHSCTCVGACEAGQHRVKNDNWADKNLTIPLPNFNATPKSFLSASWWAAAALGAAAHSAKVGIYAEVP
eukprot:356460-Chlamydomonas_euryale.AAC.14